MAADHGNLVTPAIYSDEPLRANDNPAFQFDTYTDTLVRTILSRDTRAPLTISISGEWGTGKTTLMRVLQDKLEDANDGRKRGKLAFLQPYDSKSYGDEFRPCRTVWFNAWKYSRQEEMFVALIELVLRRMESEGFLKKVRAKLADPKQSTFNLWGFSISAISQILSLGQIEYDVSKYEQESRFRQHWAFYDEFQNFFEGLLNEFVERDKGGVLVVLIDDLDRCIPSKIVQVLESIKLFMDRPGCIFVLGADHSLIAKAVQAHYDDTKLQDLDGAEYLDKIVQVKFELPKIREEDIEQYVRSLPSAEEPTGALVTLVSRGLNTNPRKIKTFLNFIELQWAILANSGGEAAENASKEGLVEWALLTQASDALRSTLENLESDAARVNLIASLKSVAEETDAEEVDKLIKGEKTLLKYSDLARDEKILNVLRSGKFSFDVESIGLYVHRTPPPPVLEAKAQESFSAEEVTVGAPERDELVSVGRDDLMAALGTGEPLIRLDLVKMDLRGVDFRSADLSESWLDQAKLSGANLEGCRLRHADMYFVDADEASFKGANLSYASLDGSSLIKANFVGCSLHGTSVSEVDLTDADLRDVDFSDATIDGGNLAGADCRGARNILDAINWDDPPEGLKTAEFDPTTKREIDSRLDQTR